jgi:hypothetical protein
VTLTFTGASDGELGDGSKFTVTDADGKTVGTGTIDLTVPDRNVMKADVTITDPGIYTVKWTSVSADGATLNGQFSFGYKATQAIPAASGGEDNDEGHGTPDTSIASDTGSPLAPLGALLILSAAGLLVRRGLVAQAR